MSDSTNDTDGQAPASLPIEGRDAMRHVGAVRVDDRGRITIPVDERQQMDLSEGDYIEAAFRCGSLR